MKLRKVVPDHQRNMIVENMQGITAGRKHQNAFKKKHQLAPIRYKNKDRSMNNTIKDSDDSDTESDGN